MVKVFFLLLVLVFSLSFLFKKEVLLFFAPVPRLNEALKEVVLAELKKEIISPPPLRSKEDYPTPFLTAAGIIRETNRERALAGLSSFRENSLLNSIALQKVNDMFSGQYFDHVSPSGKDVGDLAKINSYEYIMIGENLALGNFENDAAVTKAWMESPGHRANILHPRYSEMGAAARQGSFEGRTVWLAVQVFGLPVSACPYPSPAIQELLREYIKEVEKLKPVLDGLREELENARPRRGAEYNQRVEEYNSMVEQYNELVLRTKELTESYNEQVRAANKCIQGE